MVSILRSKHLFLKMLQIDVLILRCKYSWLTVAALFCFLATIPAQGAVGVGARDIPITGTDLYLRVPQGVVVSPYKSAPQRVKLHSTNPIERLNKEVKRWADVVGICPNEESIVRLIGAVFLEQNDEWQLQTRYMQGEAMAELNPQPHEMEIAQITPKAA